MQQEERVMLAALQQSFSDFILATGLKPGEVCRALLDGTPIGDLDTVDLEVLRGFIKGAIKKIHAMHVRHASLREAKWSQTSA